jgi:hypothetical protein
MLAGFLLVSVLLIGSLNEERGPWGDKAEAETTGGLPLLTGVYDVFELGTVADNDALLLQDVELWRADPNANVCEPTGNRFACPLSEYPRFNPTWNPPD